MSWLSKFTRNAIACDYLEQMAFTLGRIMATLIDIQNGITKIGTDANDKATAVAAAQKGLSDQVAALQAQLASGSMITQADLDALMVQVQAVQAQVLAI